MDQPVSAMDRRSLLLVGSLSLISTAWPWRGARADPTDVENANIAIVKDFCAAWEDDSPNVERIVGQYMTEDCVVRFGDRVAPATGRHAVIALLKSFFGNGEHYQLKILDTFARGPVVMNSRIDGTMKGERTVNPTPVVGVFILRESRIREWSDYT